MIFGGLEFVAGGYLLHRHYKHKNEKKRQVDEVEARRHNTFPGAKPTSYPQQQHAQHQHYQQPVMAQQKYPCYGQPAAPQPQPQQQYAYPPQPYAHAQPPPLQHASSFTIPRRPVPEHKPPPIIIQSTLQRTDSFATLSRMPIADGRRPQDLPQDDSPVLPPRRHATGGLQPAAVHGVYGNVGYSVSTPALGATPTSPGLTYVMGTSGQALGGHSTDDNWETYEQHGNGMNGMQYAPTEASTELGERDPPPPYRP